MTDIVEKLTRYVAGMGTRNPKDYAAFLTVEEAMEAGKEINNLRKRVADLEYVLSDLPGYIDNWSWMKTHFDILKTVPNFPFYSELAKRLEDENES